MTDWANGTSLINDSLPVFKFHNPDLTYAVPVGIILGIFTILTVGGNLLVLIAVGTDKHLRAQRHTLLIVNLACFDMTLGFSVFPLSASLEILDDQWLFGRILCNIWAAIDVLCCTGSIWSLVSIALDRLVGVTKPLAYAGIMTRKRIGILIGIIWTLSIIISVVPFMGWSVPEDPNPYKCNVQTDVSYVFFSVSVSYYIPLIIILIFYFRIYRAASQHLRSLQSGEKRSSLPNNDGTVMTIRIHKGKFSSQDTQRPNVDQHGTGSKLGRTFARQKKATITLTIIIIGFVCMWQGFFLVLPISVLCPDSCHIPVVLWKILFWLGYCNSLMNPFIYAAASPEFRRAFKRILCCELFRKKRLRNRTYTNELGSMRRTAGSVTDHQASNGTMTKFFRCLQPCACLDSGHGNYHEGETNSSDTLGSGTATPSLSHSSIFRKLVRKPSEKSPDPMEDFPLKSMTIARLKNPGSANDLLYGSLQALAQTVALEDEECFRDSHPGLDFEERLTRPSLRNCGTQTPPLSAMGVYSESCSCSSSRLANRDPPAPDDAVL